MKTNRVDTAVIPAAGVGTRFLPFTKEVPKAFVPLVATPIIHYLVEGLKQDGIKNIFVVAEKNQKNLIKNHFSPPSATLTKALQNSNNSAKLGGLVELTKDMNITVVNQEGPYGNGTPILNLKDHLGNNPFLYVWADSFVLNAKNKFTYNKLIETYDRHNCCVLTALKLDDDESYSKFGYLGGKKITDTAFLVNEIIEKPGKENAPSNLASVGACLFTPDIYKYTDIAKDKLKSNGELYYNDALKLMLADNFKIIAKVIENGKYFDIGNKLDFLKTQVYFGEKDPEVGSEFKKFLQKHIEDL